MLNKFEKHPHKAHFLVYCATYIFYGTLITGLGPLIPYFSARSGIIETEYSFVFSCRSFGALGGAILLKMIQQHKINISFHHQLAVTSFILVFSSALFSWSTSFFYQGFWMFVSGIGYSAMEIVVNICAMKINPPQQMQFWLLLIHGFFGVGGLIGPIIVYIFGINSFPVIGISFIALIVAYVKLPCPTNFEIAEKTEMNTKGDGQRRGMMVPRKVQALLCFSLFVYIGMENTYGGWISSYSILANVSTTENAAIFSSIFWVMITLFRFLLAFLPGTTNHKMKLLIQGNIVTTAISLALIYMGFAQMSCYLSAVLYGISMSSLFILVLSINSQFGFELQQFQTSNIITCGVLGEGVLTMIAGILMQKISINMLFYSLAFMAILMEICRRLSVDIFQQSRPKETNQTQLLQRQ